jgi:cytosine permease
MIFWSAVMGVTAIYGFKSMAIVSYIALPLMAILMVIVMWMGFREMGSMADLFGVKPQESMGVISAITIIVGTFASGGTQVANWGRFAKNAKTAFIAAILAFFIGNGIMVFSGMIGGFAFQTGDLIELMITLGLTFWALIILTLNIWTTNNATAYAFGVAGAEMFNKTSKNPFIIGGVIIATIVAVAGIGEYFLTVLGLLGTFIPPLGGSIIGDYFFTYKRRLPKLEYVTFRKIRIAPLLAYLIGCAAAYFGGVCGIGVPALQGILIAAFSLPLINLLFRAAGVNDRHTVADDAEYV